MLAGGEAIDRNFNNTVRGGLVGGCHLRTDACAPIVNDLRKGIERWLWCVVFEKYVYQVSEELLGILREHLLQLICQCRQLFFGGRGDRGELHCLHVPRCMASV